MCVCVCVCVCVCMCVRVLGWWVGARVFRMYLSLSLSLSLSHTHTHIGQVKEAHRTELVAVVSRILYAKVVQRKVQGARTSLAQRRATVLAFFAALRQEEFGELVGVVLLPTMHLYACMHVCMNTYVHIRIHIRICIHA